MSWFTLALEPPGKSGSAFCACKRVHNHTHPHRRTRAPTHTHAHVCECARARTQTRRTHARTHCCAAAKSESMILILHLLLRVLGPALPRHCQQDPRRKLPRRPETAFAAPVLAMALGDRARRRHWGGARALHPNPPRQSGGGRSRGKGRLRNAGNAQRGRSVLAN